MRRFLDNHAQMNSCCAARPAQSQVEAEDTSIIQVVIFDVIVILMRTSRVLLRVALVFEALEGPVFVSALSIKGGE